MKLPVNYKGIPINKRWMIREAYVEQQNGLCHHCKAPLDGEPAKKIKSFSVNKKLFPKGFFSHPVHLHHDHETGITIGAIHCYCNAVLWQYFRE